MRFPYVTAVRKLLVLNYTVALQYRAQSVLWMITGTVPLIMMTIWLQLAGGGSIKGYDATTFAQYFMFMFLARQTTPTWVIYLLDRGVKHGELSPLLLRPMHPVWQYATEHWGEMALRVPIIAPLAAIGLLIADAWSMALLANLPFFIAGLLMAWAINFMMHLVVGLIAFWSDNALGYDMMIFSLYTMLGGVVVPIELFPDVVRGYLAWTPFPYILDFPVRAAIGRIEGVDLIAGFGMQALWLGLLFTVFTIGWRISLKRFSAAGA